MLEGVLLVDNTRREIYIPTTFLLPLASQTIECKQRFLPTLDHWRRYTHAHQNLSSTDVCDKKKSSKVGLEKGFK